MGILLGYSILWRDLDILLPRIELSKTNCRVIYHWPTSSCLEIKPRPNIQNARFVESAMIDIGAPPNQVLPQPRFQKCSHKEKDTFNACPSMLHGLRFNQCFSTQKHWLTLG